MTHEMRLVDGDVLDADTALVAANLDDPIYQQERVAVREQIHDLQDVRRSQLSLCHASHSPPESVHETPHSGAGIRSSFARTRWDARFFRVCSSRNQSRTGFAGVPPHRDPGGTSLLTLLEPAICAPMPIRTWPTTPPWPPMTTKSSSVVEPAM